MADSSSSLSSYLDSHADEAQGLLEQLCRQPSIAAKGIGMPEMADLVESLLQDAGFETQRCYAEGAPPAIYGELKGSGPYTVLLYNHYDVQPAEPFDLWQSPPFEPTVRNGMLYARGVADNKGEIGARLAAIRALRATTETLPITIRWIIEGEEEIGSPHFDAIASKYASLLQADGSLWEGASFDVDDRPILTLGTKGLLYVQLDVQGTGIDAHSGAAAILPSAAWRLVQTLATLRAPDGHVRISGFYETVKSPTKAQREAIAEETDMDGQLMAAYQVERFLDDLKGAALREHLAFSPTCNIAGLGSGYTGEGIKTVLPARATAKIDFRLVPDQDPQDILFKLQAYLKNEGCDDFQITVLAKAESVVTPIETPFVQRILSIAQSFADKPPSIVPIAAGTLPLLGALRRYVGLPGLSAPGNPSYWGSQAHAPNEHIRLSDLSRAVRYNCYMFQELGK